MIDGKEMDWTGSVADSDRDAFDCGSPACHRHVTTICQLSPLLSTWIRAL